jgi:hypothetical protein
MKRRSIKDVTDAIIGKMRNCASLQIRACFPLYAVYAVAVAFWRLAITLKCGETKILSACPGSSWII